VDKGPEYNHYHKLVMSWWRAWNELWWKYKQEIANCDRMEREVLRLRKELEQCQE
jgi:hypothetical protein